MMRLTVCLLALLTLLSACGGEPKPLPDLAPINDAVTAFNGEALRSVSFVLNVTARDAEESTFFTQGTVSYRKDAPVGMSGRMTQIYKGVGTTADVYYKAGAYYRSDNNSKYYLKMDKEALLGQFMCTDLPTANAEKISSATTAETGAGTKYTLKAELDPNLLLSLFGDTLFTSCGLRKPDKAKTRFKNTELVYVVGDGVFKSFKLTARVVVYETAPYYPNYQTPEKELMHEFDISYELKAVGTGEGVEIDVPKTEDYVYLS